MLQEPMMEKLTAMRLLSWSVCACWWINSGLGGRIKRWRGACTLPNSKALQWRTSTIALPVVSTRA